MAGSNENRCGNKHKKRLMEVKRILEEESDKDHRFSVKQLLDRLGLAHTEANMRAVRSDIKVLQEFNVAVKRVKHRTFEYFVASRRFQPYELEVLVDIVQSSRSIDEQTAANLTESILGLGSQGEAQALRKVIHLGNRAKTSNEEVFRNIGIISGALADTPRHKVSFEYFDIGYDLGKAYRYEGQPRIETPILLTYMYDCFYMIAYSEEHDAVIARRLDRMTNVVNTEKKAVTNERIRNFNLEDFEHEQFGMFLGKARPVTLQINDERMMDPLYDHFGDQLKGHVIPPAEGKPALARIKVIDSPQFRGWVAGMNGKLEIVE